MTEKEKQEKFEDFKRKMKLEINEFTENGFSLQQAEFLWYKFNI